MSSNSSTPINKTPSIHTRSIMSPSKMIIWGFNLIVGYTFLISYSSVFQKMGNLMPVVIIIGSILAFVSGIAFGKMSQYFNRNGGVLLYTRATFGHKAGGIIGMYQLLQLPVVAATVAIGFAWAFTGINNLNTNVFVLVGAVVLFLILSFIPRYNFTTNRISLLILWVMKWFIIIALAIMAIIQIKSFGQNIAKNNYRLGPRTYFDFIEATVTFFFAFGGFEAIASISDDLKDSEDNMVRVLITIITCVCVTYMVYYFLIIGAVGVNIPGTTNRPNGIPVGTNTSDFNPINSVVANLFFKGDSNKLKFGATASGTILSLLLIVTQIANKGSSRLQAGWANTRIISAYAACGYLPESFLQKNKYHQYIKAFWLDFIVSGSFAILFIAFRVAKIKVLYSGALGIVAYISFVQYSAVLASILKIKFSKKELFSNKKKLDFSYFMAVIYAIIFAFIMLLLISYIADGIDQLIQYNRASPGRKADFDNTIWVSALILIGIFLISVILLICSYRFKWIEHAEKIDEQEVEDEIDRIVGHPDHPEYRGPN